MKRTIIRAKSMGYCMGVEKAISVAEQALSSDLPIYSHGLLIHNKKELQRLSDEGLHMMNEDTQLPSDATLVIRAHGIHPKERKQIESTGVSIIDATCPLVLVNQNTIKKKAAEGCTIIIVGHPNHPEMKALVGFADNIIVIEGVSDVGQLALDRTQKYFLMAQTTLRPAIFEETKEALSKYCDNLEVLNTICAATKQRQEAIISLAKEVDCIVIVGDHESANSKGLRDLALSLGVQAFLIESEQEVNSEILSYEKVGLSAAASAPGWLIDQVEKALSTD